VLVDERRRLIGVISRKHGDDLVEERVEGVLGDCGGTDRGSERRPRAGDTVRC
jgi:hypothetical protein